MQTPMGTFGKSEEELKKLLNSEEARTLAAILQKMDGGELRRAAEAAASGGDSSALEGILGQIASNPLGRKALTDMEKKAKGQ